MSFKAISDFCQKPSERPSSCIADKLEGWLAIEFWQHGRKLHRHACPDCLAKSEILQKIKAEQKQLPDYVDVFMLLVMQRISNLLPHDAAGKPERPTIETDAAPAAP